jgi:hypothetical protein
MMGLAFLSVAFGSVGVVSCTRIARADDATLAISSLDLGSGTRVATLSAHNMAPGDRVTTALTVVNSSDRPVSYAMRAELGPADGAPLAAALILTIKTVGSSCARFDGTTLFGGSLAEAAVGREGGGRPLLAATAEILCFRTELPADTGNALQLTATTVTLTFDAPAQEAVR